MSVPDQRVAESKLDEVFWNICKSHYIERDKPIFPDDCVYKLFRIFSMLGEMVENDEGQIEVASNKHLLILYILSNIPYCNLNFNATPFFFSHKGGNGRWRGRKCSS